MHDHTSHDPHAAPHRHGVADPPSAGLPAGVVAEDVRAAAAHGHQAMAHDV
jgi:hypothetical protein